LMSENYSVKDMTKNKKRAIKTENIHRRRRRISIKWRVFSGFAIFTAVILLLMWLFQIVFLDSIYRTIKYAVIKDSAKQIIAKLDSGDIETTAENLAEKNELCVYIISPSGQPLLSVDSLKECAIHNITNLSIYTIYSQTVQNGGELVEVFRYDRESNRYYSTGEGIYSDKSSQVAPNFDYESLIYSTVVSYGDELEALLMLNVTITPVDATVMTLNTLFVFMTLIMIILAVTMALVLSKYISKPIESLNKEAKQLAEGRYDVEFTEKGYREAAELGLTLNYAASELGKVDSLRRELIANISHDLRTPLTMIRGYAEVMRDIPGENTPENASVIVDESSRLSSLVNDVLDISKIESGNMKPDIRRVNITETIGTTVERYRKMLESKGYNFGYFAENDFEIDTDETLVMQAVCNLLNNAVTYTGEDRNVIVNLNDSPINNGFIRISVTDTGNGVDPEKLPYIWDRYYKVDTKHKRSAIGTGLGLSIVKSVMIQLGGNCGIISRPGVGSTFWIELVK